MKKKLYKIKPGKTAPQGILLLFASIMLAILGINVLFYSAFPQYATYGRQFYQEQTSNNTYTAKICNLDSPKGLFKTKKKFKVRHCLILFF